MEVSDLSCPLCNKLYNRDTRCPRILPCGHTFCHLCLSELFTHRVVRCPEDLISLATRKAAELPQNHIVLKLALKAGGHQPAQKCPDHHKPMEYFCLDERIRICASCGLMGIHRGHMIQTEEELSKEFDLRIQVLCDMVSVIQASQESSSEVLSEDKMQALFDKFISRKADLESKLRTKFTLLRHQLTEAEKKASGELRKNSEQVELIFSQMRDMPQELHRQVSTIKDEVRTLIDQIDSGKDTIAALELVSNEAERLLPIGEKALMDLENQKVFPQLLEEVISNLDYDVDALSLESIGKAVQQASDDTFLIEPEEKHVRAPSISDMQLPAPAPLNETEFAEILDNIGEGNTATADFSQVGGVGDKAVQMAPFLLANESLKKLRFANNQLTSLSLCTLFKAIEGNTSLEELDLEKNTLDTEVCDRLLETLKENQTLTRISLKGCWIGQADSARLRSSDPRIHF